MKRRILLEVDVDDRTPGSMLEILNRIVSLLKELQESDYLIKYGLDLLPRHLLLARGHVVSIETMEVPEE